MKSGTDVVIMGAGMAGLTLALQLRKSSPDISIKILDEFRGRAPEKTHRVGESMVEVSSWYLREVLGLGDHLLSHHLPKFGLRFYLSDGDNSELGMRPEYGVLSIPHLPGGIHSVPPGIHLPTYNIDRGRLDNYLLELCTSEGIEIRQGCKVKDIQLGDEHHEVQVENELTSIKARWVIDASGRAGILGKKFDLRREDEHNIHVAWFRVEGKVDPEKMTEDTRFHQRLYPGLRWLSTNHFMGNNYWIWIIPLPGDATSIGLVMNPDVYEPGNIVGFEDAMTWLERMEPQLAEIIKTKDVLDFKVLQARSYYSLNSFSEKRWAMTGEAAFFCDPLYSPGGDFIAVGNTLVTQMVLSDLANDKKKLALQVRFGDYLVKGMFRHYMSLCRDSFSLMGKQEVMLQKIAWDTAVYFGYNVFLFRNGVFCEPGFHRNIQPENAKLENLQKVMRAFLHASGRKSNGWTGRYLDQIKLDPVHSLYHAAKEPMEGDDLLHQLKSNIRELEFLAKNMEEFIQ